MGGLIGGKYAGKFALVIGNSHYDDPAISQLTMPGQDAEKLAEVLKSAEIGGFDQVTELIDQPEGALRKAIAHFFADRQKEDLLLLYFSGHGVLDDQGLLYFAAKDTEHQSLSATAVPASFVRQEMDRSYSRRQVLVLDCCHSGAFGRGAKGVRGASVGTATRFEVEGYGRVVLTASDFTQYAWEGDHVEGQAASSLFTRFLVEGLRTGEADQDGDGQVEADEWYDYAYRQVSEATPKQKPQKFADRVEGPLVIAHSPRGVTKLTVLPSELRQALEDTRSFVRLGAVSELAKLLKADDMRIVEAARAALERLKCDDSRAVSQAASEALAVPFVIPIAPAIPVAPVLPVAPAVPVPTRPHAPPAQAPPKPPAKRSRWVWLGAGVLMALVVVSLLNVIWVGFMKFLAWRLNHRLR